MKILIAEDNADSRFILKKSLEYAGHEVLEASNGLEAMKQTAASVPDLIISDILMPEMDGFGLCRQLKLDKRLWKIPFIFYTATYTDPADERFALALGASRFIRKPAESREFLKIIDEVIREQGERRLNVPTLPIEEDTVLDKMHEFSLERKLSAKIRALETERSALLKKEFELKASEEKYRKLVETASDAIIAADAETGLIIEANISAERLLGIPVKKLKGMHQSQLHPPEYAVKYSDMFSGSATSGQDAVAPIFIVNSSGSTIPAEVSISTAQIGGRNIVQGIYRDITDRARVEEAVLNIAKGVSAIVGDKFFYSLVEHLSKILGADYAYIAEVMPDRPDHAMTLALYAEGSFIDNIEVPLTGTPCETVMEKTTCSYPSDIRQLFPRAQTMASMNVEGYIGTKLISSSGNALGLMSVMFRKPVSNVRTVESTLRIFAARASAELERRYAEEAVHESEKRFRLLSEVAFDGIAVTENGVFLEMNEEFAQIFGYTPAELAGEKISKLSAPECLDDVMAKVRSGHARPYETECIKKDGSRVQVEVFGKSFPFKERARRITAIRDITGRKLAEEALTMTLKQVEKANRELSDFAHIISHDLKVPLRAVYSLAKWITEDYADKFDDEGKQKLDLLMGRVRGMNDLVDGILRYSRAGRLIGKKAAIQINELILEVINSLELPGHIHIAAAEGLPVVACERTSMVQVFQNLIDNAVRHIDKPEGEIKTGFEDSGDFWTFYVSDNGTGIAEEDRDRIFQMFGVSQQEDRNGASGIGLAVVKKIVEMYGGQVWVESEVGKGSSFYFTIPK